MRVPVKNPRRIFKVGERYYSSKNYRVTHIDNGKEFFELYGTKIDVTETINGILARLPEMREFILGGATDAKPELQENPQENSQNNKPAL